MKRFTHIWFAADMKGSHSPKSRRNFGERMLTNFITNIMAAIFDFNGSGRLGREINLYQGAVDGKK